MKKLSNLSVVFPALNDELSIVPLIKKTLTLLPKITSKYEIIVVNDGGTDETANVLKRLKQTSPFLKVISHRRNRGYGATLTEGFRQATGEFIFYTDGDGQYDVLELKNLVQALDEKTDFVTGFKLNRADSRLRQLVGSFYNQFVKKLFNLKIKDVDCDFRLFRRKILKGITFKTRSGAFDVEFIKKLQNRGVRFKEVPVHHYPRLFGQSQFFKPGRVIKSLWELGKICLERY